MTRRVLEASATDNDDLERIVPIVSDSVLVDHCSVVKGCCKAQFHVSVVIFLVIRVQQRLVKSSK